MISAERIAQSHQEHLHPSDPLENAVDVVHDIYNTLDGAQEWFVERNASEGNSREIRSNFRKPMLQRRSRAELSRVRFDVHLWAAVKVGDGNGDEVR